MRTDHPTFEQHRRAETQARVGEGGGSGTDPKPHPERFSYTGRGEAVSPEVTHMYHTHTQHFISYLLIYVPSQGFPMTKRRG